MPLILPGNVATATASTTYEVANSCRLEDGDSPHMQRSISASPTNEDKYTFSCWVKRGNLVEGVLLGQYSNSSNRAKFGFDSNGKLEYFQVNSGSTSASVATTQLFRDVSAWYHIVLAYDSTQGTAANRIKFYVNGTVVSSYADTSYPAENLDSQLNRSGNLQMIGQDANDDKYFDGYLAEVVLIDGQALDATSFGEYNSDSPTIWQPIDVSGLTFGDDGFYLDFEDSGDLGDDESGKGNDFAETNLAAIDQSTDTCTLNYSVMNPLNDHFGGHTFSQGNLKVVAPSGNAAPAPSTFGLSNGRWYAEVKLTALGSNQTNVGFSANQPTSDQHFLGQHAHQYGYYNGNGKIYNSNDAGTSYGGTYAQGEIVGMYLDLEDNKIYFSIDGTLQNSGTGHTITAAASTDLGAYFFAVQHYDNSTAATYELNFGGTSTFTISSAVSDDNGHGSFEFSPNITGDGSAKKFYAVNSKNLAEFG
jgi:hypothetical protein